MIQQGQGGTTLNMKLPCQGASLDHSATQPWGKRLTSTKTYTTTETYKGSDPLDAFSK